NAGEPVLIFHMARGTSGISAFVLALGLNTFLLVAQPILPSPGVTNAAPLGLSQPSQAAPLHPGGSITNGIPTDPRSVTALKEVQPGIFQFGDVKLNKRQRTIR